MPSRRRQPSTRAPPRVPRAALQLRLRDTVSDSGPRAAGRGVPGPQGLGGADLLQQFPGAGSVRCAAAAPRSAPPGLGRREEAPLGAVYVLLQFGKDRVFPGRSPSQLCRPWDVSFPFPSRRNSMSSPSVGKGARHPWFVVTLKYVSKASPPRRAG